MKLVFITGPRRSGKDTAVSFLTGHYDVGHTMYHRTSIVLRNRLIATFALHPDAATKLWEEHKDAPSEIFLGLTPRAALIAEFAHLQRTYGDHILGTLSARYLRRHSTGARLCIVDVGRRNECLPLVRAFGSSSCLLIRLHRDNCVFDDGREEVRDIGCKEIDIQNCFDLEMYEAQVTNAVDEWLGIDEDLG